MKMDPIRIRRSMANGLVVEIELTETEVYRIFEHYEHHADMEYTYNELSQRQCEELMPLSAKQWADAVRNIAWEKRRQQDKYNFDEDYALDEALRWYIKTILPEMPKRYFEIKLGKADDNNVANPNGCIYCWAYDMPTLREAAAFCAQEFSNEFEEVINVEEIDRCDITAYCDESELEVFEFVGKADENDA